MAILENIPLILHSLLKIRKHRLAIISAGSRTPIKCSQFHDPLPGRLSDCRKVLKTILLVTKVIEAVYIVRDPSDITLKINWCSLQVTHSFSIKIGYKFIT